MKLGSFSKFRSQAIVLLAFSVLMPASIVATYNILSFRKVAVDNVEREMQSKGQENARTIVLFLEAVRADLRYLQGQPSIEGIFRSRDNTAQNTFGAISEAEWRDRLGTVFTTFAKSRQYYEQIRYLDETGNEIVRVDSRDGDVVQIAQKDLQFKGDRDYFKDAITLPMDQFYTSKIELNREQGKIETPYNPVIRYALPIQDDLGRPRGILIANLSINFLFNLASSEQGKSNINSELSIINDRGYYLLNADQSKQWGEDLGHSATIYQDMPDDLVEVLLSDRSGLGRTDDALIAYQTVYPAPENKQHAFTMIYRTPKSLLFAPIVRITIVSAIVTVAATGSFIFLGILIFNRLVNRVHGVTQQIKAFSDRVTATTEDYESVALQQSAAVQETTATVDRLCLSSEQSASEAASAVLQAQQSRDRVRSGLQESSEVLTEMERLQRVVNGIAQQIATLNERAVQIGNISSLVGDLANQTNMLALNAAVEAVRAGESGRGFAVVAAEIRQLSDTSQQSGQRIEDIVSEIQGEIKTTLATVRKGTTSADAGMRRVQAVAASLEEMAIALDAIAANSETIAQNSQEQASATQQVTLAMANISSGAQQAAAGIQSIREGTSDIAVVATELQESI